MLRILDSFAGAGGFSLGFSMAANTTLVGAIELDDWAAETFAHNHPETPVLVGDIQAFSDDELLAAFGPHRPNVILGGPPCQGYSICNKNAGDPTDPRNSLFQEFVRLGRLFEPAVMVMENVPNLVKARTHGGHLVLDLIRAELEGLGFHVYHRILNATDYGVPQIRRRLIVVASRQALAQPFPAPTHTVGDGVPASLFAPALLPCPTLWDAIGDLPLLDACQGEEVLAYTKGPQSAYQARMRQGAAEVFNHRAMRHSKRMVARFASMAWGDSSANVADHLKPLKRNGNGEISDKVYDQNNRRMPPHKPCHTIAASFYANFVHPYQHRNFTPREGARIQSFPDWYRFKGKPTVVSQKLLAQEGRTDEKHLAQYNQIGNAVPPLLAQAIAENLVAQLQPSTLEPVAARLVGLEMRPVAAVA